MMQKPFLILCLFIFFSYLIGCDNDLARLHTRNPEACDKVGGVIIMHIEDLRKFAMYWLLKTQEVRADKEHYGKELTGDIYESGWISEMYGYSFGAAEVILITNLNFLLNNWIRLGSKYNICAAEFAAYHKQRHFDLSRLCS